MRKTYRISIISIKMRFVISMWTLRKSGIGVFVQIEETSKINQQLTKFQGNVWTHEMAYSLWIVLQFWQEAICICWRLINFEKSVDLRGICISKNKIFFGLNRNFRILDKRRFVLLNFGNGVSNQKLMMFYVDWWLVRVDWYRIEFSIMFISG